MEETEKTLKDLQVEAVALGVPAEDAAKFMTKGQVTIMINAIKASKAVASLNVTSLNTVDPKEDRSIEKQWMTKAQKQFDFWNEQPKVRILVPKEGKEPTGVVRWEHSKKEGRDVQVHVSGTVQTVIENGAKYLVPVGVYTEVPEPIAMRIQEKFQQTTEAGNDMLIDRVDPLTGKPVGDQL